MLSLSFSLHSPRFLTHNLFLVDLKTNKIWKNSPNRNPIYHVSLSHPAFAPSLSLQMSAAAAPSVSPKPEVEIEVSQSRNEPEPTLTAASVVQPKMSRSDDEPKLRGGLSFSVVTGLPLKTDDSMWDARSALLCSALASRHQPCSLCRLLPLPLLLLRIVCFALSPSVLL